MIRVVVGISSERVSFRAGVDAAKDALSQLDGAPAIAGIVLASVAFDQDQFLAGIASVFPTLPIAGGSTAGELSSDGLARDSSGILVVIASDQLSILSSAVHHIGSNPRGSGAEFARLSRSISPSARHALLFADPLSGDLEDLLAGFSEALEGEMAVTGVGTGDDLLYRETYQYRDKAAHTHSVTALLMSGTYTIATASAHGFIPIGMPEEVTQCDKNVIEEIDHRPALDLYRSYFGLRHMDLLETAFGETTATYPLGIRTSEGHVVRIPTAVTKKEGLALLRYVPVGSEVRLMVGDIDVTLEGARQAARKILQDIGPGKRLKGLLVFSSAARKRLLGLKVDDEIRALQEVIGRDVPIAGMYGYAEITGVPPHVEQATMTLWGIAE